MGILNRTGYNLNVKTRITILFSVLITACTTQVIRLPHMEPRKNSFFSLSSGRRTMEWQMCNPPMPCAKHQHITIGKHHGHGSASVGTVTNGYIVNPATLPIKGPFWQVMDKQAARRTNFGTDEMVALVKRTARAVALKYPGSIMQVGNMAACGGGPIPWSVSHRSGRDVDIAFYFLDQNGKQVRLTDMIHVQPDGTATTEDGRTVVFDDARNWWMIRSIITDKHVSVQWIFIARFLKRRLLNFAKEHGEKREIISKAAQAMWQPYRSSAHADHIHLRIYCPVDDLVEGCRDIGTNRPWYVEHPDVINRRVKELIGLLHGRANIRVKKQAVEILGAIRDPKGDSAIAGLLRSSNISLRRAAAFAVFRWGMPRETAETAIQVLARDIDGKTALYLLYALKRYHGVGRCAFMCRLLDSNREWTVKAGLGTWRFRAATFAARVLGLRGETLALPALIEHMDQGNLRDRNACLWAVRRITNRTLVFNAPHINPSILRDTWQSWYRWHHETSRLGFLVSGFAIDGLISHESANSLDLTPMEYIKLYKEAIAGDNQYNAIFLLSRLLGISRYVPRNTMHSSLFFFSKRLWQKLKNLGIQISGPDILNSVNGGDG